MNAPARTEILERIAGALRDVPPEEAPADVRVERGYRDRDDAPREELVARFAERVEEYRARVRRVNEAGLTRAVARCLRERGVRRLVAPPGLPEAWLPKRGIEVLRDAAERPLSHEELDAADGVLSACALGIAQTGTIVLDGGPGQGRRALTLLPDYHLCAVRAEQVVGLVPEAVAALGDAARAGSPLTWISGPSATSDIELSRVEGVHGPRTLEVLLVG